MNFIAIADAKTADLVAFYNVNVVRLVDGTVVKKFADRKTAEKRVADLVEKLAAHFPDQEIPENHIPNPNAGEAVPETAVSDISEGAEEGAEPTETDEERADREAREAAAAKKGNSAFNALAGVLSAIQATPENGEAPKPIIARSTSPKASNSDGVAASWVDSEVRAARLTRDGVEVKVDGEVVGTYKSTRDAFRANRLPDNKHIRFRLKLKEAHRENGGSATFEHNGKKFVFAIVAIAVE